MNIFAVSRVHYLNESANELTRAGMQEPTQNPNQAHATPITAPFTVVVVLFRVHKRKANAMNNFSLKNTFNCFIISTHDCNLYEGLKYNIQVLFYSHDIQYNVLVLIVVVLQVVSSSRTSTLLVLASSSSTR